MAWPDDQLAGNRRLSAAGGAFASFEPATGPEPTVADGVLTWSSPALDCALEATACIGRIEEPLFTSNGATVMWRCEAPAARITVSMDESRSVHGAGYAECLTMTLAPWQLPIREMRWGRFVADDATQSLVWIEWRGPTRRQWVYVNGIRCGEAQIDDDGVTTDDLTVRFTETRPLHARSMASVLSRIPAVAALAPESFRQWRECKSLSRGVLYRNREVSSTGWVIHETVVMP